MTNRQIQAAKTKEKLLETGKRLLNEKGYSAVTVDEIIEQSGVAKGTFYHHFSSKEEFFSGIQYQPYVDLDSSVPSWDCTLDEGIERYMTSYIELLCSYSPHYLTSWLGHIDTTEAVSLEDGEATFEIDFANARERDLEAFIRKSIDTGELTAGCPAKTIARLIISTLYGNIVWFCMSHGKLDMGAWIEEQVRAMLGLFDAYRTNPK